MKYTLHISKNIKQHLKCCLAYGVITLGMTTLASASDIENGPTEKIAEFNSDFLIGEAKNIDIKRFTYANAILPGDYNVDVYINGNWFGKHQIAFKNTEDNKSAYTCFSSKQLLEYGIKAGLAFNSKIANENKKKNLI